MTIAGRVHLFPSRTQQLSSLALMILGGRPPGKAGRCRFCKSRPFGLLFNMVNMQNGTAKGSACRNERSECCRFCKKQTIWSAFLVQQNFVLWYYIYAAFTAILLCCNTKERDIL